MSQTAPVHLPSSEERSAGSSGASLMDVSAFMTAQLREQRDHDEKLRQEAKAERRELEAKVHKLLEEAADKQRQEMEGKMEILVQAQQQVVMAADQLRRVTDPQLQGLQDRLHKMNAAGVLADENFYACEDAISDCVEGMATGGAAPDQLVRMVALSERLGQDDSFARQLRRKFG